MEHDVYLQRKAMEHFPNCPIEVAQQGSWYSTAKPYCNCGGNAIADSNPDNFKSATPLIHPYNCKHDWRSHKTSEGIVICYKCGKMENVGQEKSELEDHKNHGSLTPLGEEKLKALEKETDCKHKFVFSHEKQEPRGLSSIYQTVYYTICEKCGLVKSQTL